MSGEYITKSQVRDILARHYPYANLREETAMHHVNADIKALPAADVVPWAFLERYADYFCAVVSMPEFVREAKQFYASTNLAMEGGIIENTMEG